MGGGASQPIAYSGPGGIRRDALDEHDVAGVGERACWLSKPVDHLPHVVEVVSLAGRVVLGGVIITAGVLVYARILGTDDLA